MYQQYGLALVGELSSVQPRMCKGSEVRAVVDSMRQHVKAIASEFNKAAYEANMRYDNLTNHGADWDSQLYYFHVYNVGGY
jgi:hypothetical protein